MARFARISILLAFVFPFTGLLMIVRSGFNSVFGEAGADRADAEHIATLHKSQGVQHPLDPLPPGNSRKYYLEALSTCTLSRSTV